MRTGQKTFRNRITKHVKQCEVTFSSLMFVVEACHIKPFHLCSDEEKYDQSNAIMLMADIHRAFDHGYITFDDEGRIILSSLIKDNYFEQQNLGIDKNVRIQMPGKRKQYMKYHRENIFKE